MRWNRVIGRQSVYAKQYYKLEMPSQQTFVDYVILISIFRRTSSACTSINHKVSIQYSCRVRTPGVASHDMIIYVGFLIS